MDETECLGLPFPQCEPPLTKDASDIEQFRDLAVAVDSAVQALDDRLTDLLFAPPRAKMTGGVIAAGSDVTHFFSGLDYDNAGMADLNLDLIVIPEDGWYMIGGWVATTTFSPTPVNLRVEPLLNGAPFSGRQGPGYVTSGTEEVAFSDVGFFRAGDQLNFMTHHTGNPAVAASYNTRFWALQVLANV